MKDLYCSLWVRKILGGGLCELLSMLTLSCILRVGPGVWLRSHELEGRLLCRDPCVCVLCLVLQLQGGRAIRRQHGELWWCSRGGRRRRHVRYFVFTVSDYATTVRCMLSYARRGVLVPISSTVVVLRLLTFEELYILYIPCSKTDFYVREMKVPPDE